MCQLLFLYFDAQQIPTQQQIDCPSQHSSCLVVNPTILCGTTLVWVVYRSFVSFYVPQLFFFVLPVKFLPVQ